MTPRLERIRAGVLPVGTWTPPSNRSATFRYVDIGSIDREGKRITAATEIAVADAPSRARQVLQAHDVLVSTVRPNLNAVGMVPTDLNDAVGSTGFTVLRANPHRLLPRYLFHWVRTPTFVSDMVRKATGASYPAVSDRIVLDSEIPAVPLEEQRRIADILDKADAIRRKRREAIALTDSLIQSTLLEMFGDPVVNPKGWPVYSVDDLSESKQYGTAEKANENGDGTAVVRMNNLTYSGDIELADIKWVPLSKAERAKLDLRDGDVLFNRVNSLELVGKTAVWHHGDGYTFAGYLIRLRMRENALGDYVSAAMNLPSMKRALMRIAKPSINMANISASDLARVSIPLPPVPDQQRFKDFRRRVCAWRSALERHAQDADCLYDTLVARVFSVPLSAAC